MSDRVRLVGLRRAADLADARMAASLGVPEGDPVEEQADLTEVFLPALSDLPLEPAGVLAYSVWVAQHSAGLVADGADCEAVMVALVARTVLVTQLAMRELK